MLVILDLQNKLLDERELAKSFAALIEAQAEANRFLMVKMRIPELYRAGIRFQNEPWAGKFENIASVAVVIKRGWGDCDDLVAWRIGELRNQGIQATARIYWRTHDTPRGPMRLYHVEVRHPNGEIEDPSRLIGM
jgi:hypothetical protein